MRLHRLAWVAALLFLVGCDHVTKHVAKTELENQPPHNLAAGVVDLRYVENTDSAFGLLRWVSPSVRTPLLTAAQLLGGLAFLGLGLRKRVARSARGALLLLAGGALGNGIDRLVNGHVIDFIHLVHWPVFNLADMYITVGGILLVLAWRRAPPRPFAQLPA
jgi:signal peptidase II